MTPSSPQPSPRAARQSSSRSNHRRIALPDARPGIAPPSCHKVLGRGCFMAFLAVGSLLAPPAASAARIPEPDTVLFGRVTERLGERNFPIHRGELIWNLRTTGPGGHTLRLTTRLERLADGRYSYRLRIPHDVLAYDLNVHPKAIGLSAAGTRIQHLEVTLDGRPLTIQPGAVAGFELSQARRSDTRRVDLETLGTPADTDGDGLPDLWEDENDQDKYDPSDAKPLTTRDSTPIPGTGNPSLAPIRTFSEWRAAWFPTTTGDLDTFGNADEDHDGVSNFLEYAFDSDPKSAEDNAAASLPRAFRDGTRVGVSFLKRKSATDLEYRVEASTDLLNWTNSDASPLEAAGQTVVAENLGGSEVRNRFFRVLVLRK